MNYPGIMSTDSRMGGDTSSDNSVFLPSYYPTFIHSMDQFYNRTQLCLIPFEAIYIRGESVTGTNLSKFLSSKVDREDIQVNRGLTERNIKKEIFRKAREKAGLVRLIWHF